MSICTPDAWNHRDLIVKMVIVEGQDHVILYLSHVISFLLSKNDIVFFACQKYYNTTASGISHVSLLWLQVFSTCVYSIIDPYC